MPRLLSPYENTPSAVYWNARGQITRRQFDMLIAPEAPVTRLQVRGLRLILLTFGSMFLGWFVLYSLWQDDRIGFDWVLYTAIGLLTGGALLILIGVARLLHDWLAITPNSEDVAHALRKQIREGALNIRTVEGRLRFRHLVLSHNMMLCSIVVSGVEFPISQALWESLHEQPQYKTWQVFYLTSPKSPLSIARRDSASTGQLIEAGHEAVVSGHTIARRSDP